MAAKEISVKKYGVRLSPDEREQLEALISKGKSPAQRLLKARILLKADVSEAGEGWSDGRIAPLILSLTGFGQNGAVVEDPAVRQALDRLLKRKGRRVVEDVPFTIFPQPLWEMSRGERTRLFALYRATFPRWQAMNRKANGRGLYFERMVMYRPGPCDGN